MGKHSAEYLWRNTEVIVVGGNSGNPNTFWRMPTDLRSWHLLDDLGGPGPIQSGRPYDNDPPKPSIPRVTLVSSVLL